jgi:phosphatidylglycerol:prolipoprotein diacylglycerol transferase
VRPILFRLPEWLGAKAIPSYGVLMLIGTLAACLVFAWLAGRGGAPRGKAFEVLLETVIVGIVMAKILGSLLLASEPGFSLITALKSGGVWYFGFFPAFAYFQWRSPTLGLTRFDATDRMLPAVALGHAFGRIGCFLAGCCWGRECNLPWAVTFPPADHAGTAIPRGVPIHPTQLYEAGAELALFAVLAWWVLHRRSFKGEAMLLYLVGYAVSRATIEVFRADFRGSVGPLSTSQIVAMLTLLVCGPLLVRGWRRARSARAEAGGRHRAKGAGAASPPSAREGQVR